MDSNPASEGVYAVELRESREGASRADGPADKAASPLTKGASLLLALLFSLGLWVMIWAAVRS